MPQTEMPNRVKAAMNFLHMIRSTRAASGGCSDEVVTFDVPKSEAAAIDSANRLMIHYFEGHIPDEHLGPLDRGPDSNGDPATLPTCRPPMGSGGAVTPTNCCEVSPDRKAPACDAPVNQARMDG